MSTSPTHESVAESPSKAAPETPGVDSAASFHRWSKVDPICEQDNFGAAPPAARQGRRRLLIGGALAVAIIAGAGGIRYLGGGQAAPAEAVAAVPVTVQTLRTQNVVLWSAFSGRLQAVDHADIRPEVGGRVTEVRFVDGQTVKAGDILYVIDPRPYEAALASAEAKLAIATADARFAETNLKRAADLVAGQNISRQTFDQRINARDVAQAAIKSAEADLRQARLDLDHAYVKAPISGRVSRAEITPGNLVQASPNAPLLTSIVSNDGIYADFEVDEQTYLKTIRAFAGTHEQEQKIPVELTAQGDDAHRYRGVISSFDNRIDSSSGTIRARARFDNQDGGLLPGMFVSVRLAGARETTALLVPERAVCVDQNKKFVYVVDARDKAAYRAVELGQQVGNSRVVLAGLQSGDRVIVDGTQHVKPDSLVQPAEAASGVKMAAN